MTFQKCIDSGPGGSVALKCLGVEDELAKQTEGIATAVEANQEGYSQVNKVF